MSAPASKPVCKTLEVTIRRARADELEICAAIYERAGNAAFAWRPKNWFKPADFLTFARNEDVYLAESHGAILGTLSFFRAGNFIHSLYVDPEAQGFGIGTALVEAIAKVAGTPLSLKVDEPNLKARAFYARMGFTETGDSGIDQGIRWLRLTKPRS